VLYSDAPIGPVLGQLRLAQGMTKGKMAQLLDVHPDTVSRYEDDPSTISLEMAVKYCEQLTIHLSLCYR